MLIEFTDGVAPRAKMNQQRSRRFRSAQEATEKDADKAELMKMLRSQNPDYQPEPEKKTWDSNVITPGTPFMDTLAASLRYWVAYKLNTDPAWEKLKIIISDATVPGEGEHKIMEFVRSQRNSPEHDPNTRHVIYGLDADLIMLGLATHEPHFRVLREDVFFNDGKPRTCRICGQTGHLAAECKGEAKVKQGEFDEKATVPTLKPFIWLHVGILREYLAVEMQVANQPFKFDLERALDDWVFMCFFVGNDFLPHLPSLDIREQGIDTLIGIWRDAMPVMGGYVTKDGHVDLERVQFILSGLAKLEDGIFKRRKQTEERQDANAKRRKIEQEERRGGPTRNRKGPSDAAPNNGENMNLINLNTLRDRGPTHRGTLDGFNPTTGTITHDMVVNKGDLQSANVANKSAAAMLKEKLQGRKSIDSSNATPSKDHDIKIEAPETPPSALGKRKAGLLDDDSRTPGRDTADSAAESQKSKTDEPPPDSVRLWEDGYADRYYEQKFHVAPQDHEFRHKVARAYVEGLAWVLLYYFQGCPSWTWYFPYHYAPFAADFVDIGSMKLSFTKGKPFRPFEQLMGVLPAASNHAIPELFRSLMSDADSDILDFYPETFPIDLNGKKFAWQGVALLPWIDEKRLLAAMARKYPLLSETERRRNEMGHDALLFSDRHPLYESVAAHFYSKKKSDETTLTLNPRISEGLAGQIEKNPDYLPASSLIFPLANSTAAGAMPDIDDDRSMSLHYEFPKSKHIHKSMILRGVVFPQPALDHADIEATRSNALYGGRGGGRGGGYNGRGGRGGGRNHGGHGGYNGGGGNGYGARNNNAGYGNNQGHSNVHAGPPSYDDRSNPFAAHLNPQFFQNGAPIPPPGMVPPGMMPYPPQGQYNSAGAQPGYGYAGQHNQQAHGYNNNNNNNSGHGRGGYGDRGQGSYNGRH